MTTTLLAVQAKVKVCEEAQEKLTKGIERRLTDLESQQLDGSMARSRARVEELPSGSTKEIEKDLAEVKASVQALHRQLNHDVEKILVNAFKEHANGSFGGYLKNTII